MRAGAAPANRTGYTPVLFAGGQGNQPGASARVWALWVEDRRRENPVAPSGAFGRTGGLFSLGALGVVLVLVVVSAALPNFNVYSYG